MEKSKDYFCVDDHKAVAAYLGLSVPDYLDQRAKGRIPAFEEPLDSTPVIKLKTLSDWVAAGKPVAYQRKVGRSY